MSKYIINIIALPVLFFFLKSTQPGISFDKIVLFMSAEYRSSTPQMKTKSIQMTLSLESFKFKPAITENPGALLQIITFIEQLIPSV